MLLQLKSKLTQQSKKLTNNKLFSAFGHDFHFMEIVLALSFVYSTAMTVLLSLGMSIAPTWSLNVPLCSISGVAAGYMWNLYTLKRMGRSCAGFEHEIHRLGIQNDKVPITTWIACELYLLCI